MRPKILRFSSILAVVVVFLSVSLGISAQKAVALTGANWNAGHIIDDSIFFNKDSMTVDQIQAFLDAKVPSCDRWHSSSNPSYQPPYTCLKEYQENPSTLQNNYGKFNADGSPASVSGGESAAQIIWNAAQTYDINPQVIIVTLQKEQGLITDTWPWYVQYQKAMGYACPDTAPCDTQYHGFYNQVENAAWQFRQYGVNPSGFLYTANATRYVGYSPGSACSGTNVYIDNQATADLYNYTPYQPDSNVLANTNPTGSNSGPGPDISGTDSCATYGNRNFWWYFNTWFGSTSAGDTEAQLVSDLTVSPASNILATDAVHARFTLRNNTSLPLYVGGMAVAVRRLSDNANFDYALRDVTIPANGTYTYDESQVLPAADYSLEIVNYRSGVGWSNTYPLSLYNTLVRKISPISVQPPVQLTSGLTFSTMAIVPGKTVTATFQVTNPNSSAVDVGTLAVTAHDPSGNNADFAPDTNVSIPANSTYTYSQSRSFTTLGNYTFMISNYRDGIGWNTTTPAGSVARTLDATVKPNPRIISGITVTPASPVVGENTTVSFQVRNDADTPVSIGTMAVAARDPSGKNVDFAPDTNVSIPANSTYTYTQTQAFSGVGNYSFAIVNYQSSTGWVNNFPVLDSGTAYATIKYVAANPLISASLSTSPAIPVAGQNVTATFQVRNDAEYAVSIGTMAVAARDPSGKNVDFAPDSNVTIQPHTTYTYSKTQVLLMPGAYKLSIVNYRDGYGWSDSYPVSQSSTIVRSTTLGIGNNPLVTTSLVLAPSTPVVGQNATATFSITNSGDVPMSIGTMAVAARDPSGKNVDFAPDSNITIQPGATYSYSKTQAFSSVGKYSFTIVNYRDGYGWSATYPASASGITRSLSSAILANPLVVTGLTTSPAIPVAGQNVTATFQVRNDAEYAVSIGTMAVAARDPSGKNVDFAPDSNVTIQPHTTYTYSMMQALQSPGSYSLSIVNYRDGYSWSTTYPVSQAGVSRSLILKVADNPLIVSSLSVSPTSLTVGQAVTATFQVRNDAEYAVSIGTMAVAARDPSGKNVDFAPDSNVTIQPHTTYTYSQSQSFSVSGKYLFFITNYRSGVGWSNNYPTPASASIVTSITPTIN